jgi:colanic acid biosynthesis glycosyl transferase WcaI
MAMRILVVSQYFWPENFRINELAAELAKAGNQVTVLTGKPNYPDGVVFADFLAKPRDFAAYRDVGIVRVPMTPRGRNSLSLMLNYFTFALSASVIGAWRLRGREFDAVFVFQASPATVGFPGVLLRRLKRAPLSFWILDQWPETLAAVGVIKSPRILRLVGRVMSYIYDRCDLVLAQSKSMVPLVQGYTANPGRVIYWPNWSEPMVDAPVTPDTPELPAKGEHFDVMFAGNIGAAQDFGAILDAAEALRAHPRIRWLIVGDGRMADWVRSEIGRRKLEDRFVMVGRHPPERMPSFFQRADALLVALRAEPVFALTVPGKLQSYLAAGVPIVGMLDGDGGRIIEESGAGFACGAGDSAGLAAAVLKLANCDAGERAVMSERGRAYARREFDRDTLIGNLAARMRDMARENESRGRLFP